MVITMQTLMEKCSQAFCLKKREIGEFASIKANGMKFQIEQYLAEGAGNLSWMQARGMFGMMKMETLIFTPLQKDAPLLSYDRISFFGSNALIFELYDTLVEPVQAYPLFNEVKGKYAYLPDSDPGKHWYDPIKRKESLYKKCRGKAEALDALCLDYLDGYCKTVKGAKEASVEDKRRKTEGYVKGLIEQGGPATDAFLKAIGKEKTEELFEKILFGIRE